MRKNLLMKIAPALVACLPLAMYAQESINVNALKVENKISPYLYGANIEDVNHSIYGDCMTNVSSEKVLKNL